MGVSELLLLTPKGGVSRLLLLMAPKGWSSFDYSCYWPLKMRVSGLLFLSPKNGSLGYSCYWPLRVGVSRLLLLLAHNDGGL